MSTAAGFPPSAGSAAPPPLGPSPATGPMPFWAKALVGCAGVCALLGTAAGVLVMAGLWWTFTPGRQIPTDHVITPDAVAVVHLSGERNVEGVSDLVSVFLTAMNDEQWRRNRELLPEPLRWFEPLARLNEGQSGAAVTGMWLPREATVAVAPEEGGKRRVVVAANLRAFARPLRWILSHASRVPGRVERPGGGAIVHLKDDAALCFAENTLVWASRASSLDGVLQRARGQAPPDRPAFLPATTYDRWKSAWSLAVVADGGDERARSLLAGVLDPGGAGRPEEKTIGADAPPLSYVAAGVRVATADRVEARLVLAVPDAASAARWRALAESFLSREAEVAKAHGLALTGSARENAEGVVADVRLDGLRAFARRWAAEHSRMPRAPRPTRPEDARPAPPAASVALVR